LALSPRLRFKLDQIQRKLKGALGSEPDRPRPKLCPSCGTLVGATATHCHQCGANLAFSLAGASRSLGKLLPGSSPATYAILTLSCVVYVVTLLATIRRGGFAGAGGGLSGIFNLGGIAGDVLQVGGASLPWPVDLREPWRLVVAIFLHGSLLHIGFNMWVLMDIGPTLEELYGSARYFFLYVVTGVGGYIVSSLFWNFSVGGSGALLGLIGALLAITMGRRAVGMQMLRSQLIRWLIYIAIWGLLFRGIDNYAHAGGLATGFILGKIMGDRPPVTPAERKGAYALGWVAGLAVLASFAMVAWSLASNR
jgi:rhomboid protease GluP